MRKPTLYLIALLGIASAACGSSNRGSITLPNAPVFDGSADAPPDTTGRTGIPTIGGG